MDRQWNDSDLTLERLREVLDYNPQTGDFTWKVSTSNRAPIGSLAGAVTGNGYVLIGIDGKRLLAHRLAWLYVYGVRPTVIDHIDRNRANNRLSNLREATVSQNTCNGVIRSTNKSGYRGVSWNKEKRKWQARIVVKGAQHPLGYFTAKEDAAAAYRAAALKFHGDFASIDKDTPT